MAAPHGQQMQALGKGAPPLEAVPPPARALHSVRRRHGWRSPSMFPSSSARRIDLILGPGQVDFTGIAALLVRIAWIVAVTALLQWLMNTINNKITYQVVRDVRDEAFRRIQILPLKYLDAHPHGEIVSRVIADVDQFADGLLMGFTQLFTGVVTILGTLCFMLSIHPGITLVVVLLTPISLFVASFIARRTYAMFKLQSETRGRQTAIIDEMNRQPEDGAGLFSREGVARSI